MSGPPLKTKPSRRSTSAPCRRRSRAWARRPRRRRPPGPPACRSAAAPAARARGRARRRPASGRPGGLGFGAQLVRDDTDERRGGRSDGGTGAADGLEELAARAAPQPTGLPSNAPSGHTRRRGASRTRVVGDTPVAKCAARQTSVLEAELARPLARGGRVVRRATPRRAAALEVEQQPEGALGGLGVERVPPGRGGAGGALPRLPG